MNVIISNRYQSVLEQLDIDVIKTLNGEFDVDDIINQFQNFFFQRIFFTSILQVHQEVQLSMNLLTMLSTM